MSLGCVLECFGPPGPDLGPPFYCCPPCETCTGPHCCCPAVCKCDPPPPDSRCGKCAEVPPVIYTDADGHCHCAGKQCPDGCEMHFVIAGSGTSLDATAGLLNNLGAALTTPITG